MENGVRDQPRTLGADLDFYIGPACEFFLASDLGNGGAEQVIGLDPVLRAADIALQLWVAQIAQGMDATDEFIEFEEGTPRGNSAGYRWIACESVYPGSFPCGRAWQ